MNEKVAAWDHVGGQFWTKGRGSAKPSARELKIFSEDVQPNDTCVIVGASTKGLVETLLDVTLDVVVLDFSPRMCADLAAAVPDAEVLVQDITAPLANELLGSADWTISERLINRMDWDEAARAFESMSLILRPGGTMRTSVWIGLYPMDEAMIKLGRERGNLGEFWDEKNAVIDFRAANSVLNEALMPHGSIDRDTLLRWYEGRGKEKRFTESEVKRLMEDAGFENVESFVMPDATSSRMFIGRKGD